MQQIISLYDSVVEIGYPRDTILKLNTNLLSITGEKEIDDGFYVITKDSRSGLIRYKNYDPKDISSISSKYLYNIIIKDIILKQDDLVQQSNMILYILYYHVKTTSFSELSDINLTKGVILHLSNIIKLMIDKEHTAYRNKPMIGMSIEQLRLSLTFERIQTGVKHSINLRS